MRGNQLRWFAAFAVTASAFTAMSPARADLPDPTDTVIAVVREACALAWIDPVCEPVAYPDPGYRVDEDPSPDQPLALRIGSVHEHTGYSDGHPQTRPADAFEAGRTGQNTDPEHDGNTGVIVDFMLTSDHSDNEKLPITTAEICLDPHADTSALALVNSLGITDTLGLNELLVSIPPLLCTRISEADHYRKWEATLEQARAATDRDEATGEYTGFTAMRGFEWTNDRFNHLGVYFSRNITNAKIDLSYLDMDRFWNWLRRPAERGGGDDALVVFNHPDGMNWDSLVHVPDVDDRVAGMEVVDGDDLHWYVTALTNGWHIGPIGGEDEHRRAWSSTEHPKTLMLTRGRSPGDYYFALANHRTVSVSAGMIAGDPGTPASFPSVLFWAGTGGVQDHDSTVLGGVVEGNTLLNVSLDGVRAGEQVVLVSNTSPQPVPLGQATTEGSFDVTFQTLAPESGQDWYFVVSCAPTVTDCGSGEDFDIVTAPVWVAP